jgi:hypothetical protein
MLRLCAAPRAARAGAPLLLLLLLASRAGADPVASADYFPLVPGTRWTYSGDGDTETREVQPPSPPGSTLRVLRTISGPGTGESETYELTAAGILQHNLVSSPPGSVLIAFSPPIVRAPATVEAGSSGSQNGDVAIGAGGAPGTYSYAWEVLSVGPATTPGGSACDSLLLAWTLSITAFGDTTTDTAQTRLVRGLGVVARAGDVDGEPYAEQLVSSSLPFPLDADCDGILDDGDLSGTPGDFLCAAPLVDDCDDNCLNAANPDQLDSGGLNSSAANGTGDACECGDTSDDGLVNLVDVARLARELAGRAGGVLAPEKCHVLPSGPCDAAHLARLRAALAGAAPGLSQSCSAFTGVVLP